LAAFRTVLLCTGDMGFSSSKPSTSKSGYPVRTATRNLFLLQFRSLPGASRQPALQSRQEDEHLHTINGSGLAVGRTWVAIIENYQQKDAAS